MQALIYRHHKKINATRPLQINGYNIAFLALPIIETSQFLSSEDGKIWQLKFFIDSPFEQTLCVDFNDDAVGNPHLLGRACWQDNEHDATNNVKLISAASKFLRNSDTLTLAKGEDLSANRTLLTDRDGFAYFSGDDDQFKRIVLCQALAIAYVQVITSCMIRTTRSVLKDQTDETISLYENILRFNAAHYFTLPVQVERHELFAGWKGLCEHYHLKVLNQELTQQLSDVAALLSAQREKQKVADEAKRLSEENTQKQALAAQAARTETAQAGLRALETQALMDRKAREEKADKRRTYVLSLAGLFLTAMSLLSLFQLTPTQFSENVTQWKRLILKAEPAKTAEFTGKLRVTGTNKD